MLKKTNFYTTSLREQVFEYLKKEIVTMGIRPGDKISLRKISEQLGVGITPLRDAMLQLEGTGTVRILPRKGIYLREFSSKDLENLYDALGMIEEHALRTAIHKVTPEHCEIMRNINERLKQCTTDEINGDYLLLNDSFHGVYLNLSDNTYLPIMWVNIQQKLRYLPTNNVQIKEWNEQCNFEHDRIVDALAERNLKEAIHWTRDIHLNYKKREEFMSEYYGLSNLQLNSQED